MYSCFLPSSLFSGENALAALPSLLQGAQKVAVFSDRGVERCGALAKALQPLGNSGVALEVISDLPSEPTCDEAQRVVDQFRSWGAQAVVGVGGGSVMDVAKLCSLLSASACTVRDLVEDASRVRRSVRSVMIPTTFGTGAEATPNSIVALPEKALKVGIVSNQMLPDAVILDPEMVRGLPPSIAAATGLDALCHALECFTSRKATPLSDLFALEALRLIFARLESACLDADALESKSAMQLAAFYGGAAIAASGTTAVHALSYPLGGKYHIPHGVANAMLLLPVMRFNLECCRPDLERVYDAVEHSAADDKAAWVLERMAQMVKALGVPTSLKPFGVSQDDLDGLTAAGMEVTRLLNNNKRVLTYADARRIYQGLLD